MGRQQNRNDLRVVIAQEAARTIAEDGVRDYQLAKRKAAARLGVRDLHGNLPSNTEIEAALEERQRLFGGAARDGELARLRRAALAAMRLFKNFEPRLVGPVLTGTATAHDDVQLHLFSDTPELVSIMLLELSIPHEELERRLKRLSGEFVAAPAYRFLAGAAAIEVVVFDYDGLREPPASLIDGRPMRRAGLREVEELLGPA
jgi:nitroreductase